MTRLKSKAQVIRALKENKDNVTFIALKHRKEFMVGVERAVSIVQGNAIALKTIRKDGSIVDSWLWWKDIEVVDGLLQFKNDDEVVYQVNFK